MKINNWSCQIYPWLTLQEGGKFFISYKSIRLPVIAFVNSSMVVSIQYFLLLRYRLILWRMTISIPIYRQNFVIVISIFIDASHKISLGPDSFWKTKCNNLQTTSKIELIYVGDLSFTIKSYDSHDFCHVDCHLRKLAT